MTCTSTIKTDGPSRMNWICTGEDLMIVMWSTVEGRRLPLVCPRDRLEDVMSQPWSGAYDRPIPLTVEGDHLHLILPGSVASVGERLLAWWRSR